MLSPPSNPVCSNQLTVLAFQSVPFSFVHHCSAARLTHTTLQRTVSLCMAGTHALLGR